MFFIFTFFGISLCMQTNQYFKQLDNNKFHRSLYANYNKIVRLSSMSFNLFMYPFAYYETYAFKLALQQSQSFVFYLFSFQIKRKIIKIF